MSTELSPAVGTGAQGDRAALRAEEEAASLRAEEDAARLRAEEDVAGLRAEEDVAGLRAEVVALRTAVQALRARLDALEAPRASGSFAALYSTFQDRFRGSETDVRDRLAVYLPDVQRAATGRGVLDVGPGRGEWLALLAERGVPAYGVESNAAQAARIRARNGLRVVDGDAVEHLRGLPPGALDVVSAFHVIEHLDIDALLDLLAAARSALRPGGCLLLETPNPSNLVMAACNFHLDPTHLHPLPPALTSFLVETSGFAAVEVRPLHPKEPVELTGLRLSGLDEQASDLLAQALTKAFFGPQDYAVVATVPDAPGGQPGLPRGD